MKADWKKKPAGMGHDLSKWARNRGSLTEHIMSKCGDFGVRYVRNRFGRVNIDEVSRIGVRPEESAWVREVFLCCGEKPVVFAHSVASRNSQKGSWRRLRLLGQKSLGSAFLSDPKVRREEFEFLFMSRRHPLFGKACRLMTHRPERLWARRSLFIRGKNSILVTEVFLPEILELA